MTDTQPNPSTPRRRAVMVTRPIRLPASLWDTYRDLGVAVGVRRADLIRRALVEFAEEQRIALAADEIAVREFTEPDDQGDPWVRPTHADDAPSWREHEVEAVPHPGGCHCLACDAARVARVDDE